MLDGNTNGIAGSNKNVREKYPHEGEKKTHTKIEI